ncbi:MAG: hypothetical protein EHM37_24015, partial [Deltaproteobacteria bacterium]
MLLQFFGFMDNPFKLAPDPAYLFLGRHYEEALAHLRYAVTEGEGFTAITGRAGHRQDDHLPGLCGHPGRRDGGCGHLTPGVESGGPAAADQYCTRDPRHGRHVEGLDRSAER